MLLSTFHLAKGRSLFISRDKTDDNPNEGRLKVKSLLSVLFGGRKENGKKGGKHTRSRECYLKSMTIRQKKMFFPFLYSHLTHKNE